MSETPPATRPPGWSSPFAPDNLRTVGRVHPLEDITPEWAWEGSTGRGVKVAVIDSGVEASHPAVGGVQGYVAIDEPRKGEELVYSEDEHEDVYGHGTACAGIIRALAPECEIYSVRVLGPMLTGRGVVFAAGLRWAIEHGMHVANLSLTTPKQEFFGLLHELADLAYFKNVVLVTSANNMPIPSFPAMYSSVISVASHATPDPDLFYYNPEPPVEFGAHGIDVKVAWKGGGSMTMTGNSFATPHIAGLVTRILAKHPGLTPFQVKSVLRALAANVATA
ncbi:MAG TPA: S8 family serine peptidase [Actinomycetota bacterium]